MTWPDYLAVAIGLVYGVMAAGYWHQHERGPAIMFLGYAIGQIGIVWTAVAARGALPYHP